MGWLADTNPVYPELVEPKATEGQRSPFFPGKKQKDRASTSSAQTGIGVSMQGPVKRSVTIAGHETSISLEPIFWTALRDAAAEDGLPVNALVARIDAERIASDDPPNLGSAIRVWLYARLSKTRA